MIFKALDPDMPDDEVEQIISEVDEDGSGTVDYEGLSLSSPSILHILSLFFYHRILQTNDRLTHIQSAHYSLQTSTIFFILFFFIFVSFLIRCTTLSRFLINL